MRPSPVPGVGEALRELVAAGALFVVVTGRPLQSARRATAALGVEPVVFACYHGALIVEAGGTLIRHLPVPSGPARAVAAEALAGGVGVTVWDMDEPRELEASAGPGDEPGDEVSRLVLHGDPLVVARLLDELRARVDRAAARSSRSGPASSASSRLRSTRARPCGSSPAALAVPPARTVACGDGAADETLLAAAAVRIAVGEPPHVLGHLPGVVVTSWARLPDTLRAQVLPLL